MSTTIRQNFKKDRAERLIGRKYLVDIMRILIVFG